MPTVRVELSPGRSHEQKISYVEQVTRLTAEVLHCPVESVDVVFVEIPSHDWARAGKFFGQPPTGQHQ
ncbi:4-oxalocrotonate tautomerase [Pseudomonas sp. R5(2019)]|uniref:4-oxalocrotonate tautomerase n=1 Tax=Pseudomonas sp. R5(2019) TaxID=2697566 RepID=UPI001412826D|nr:4-oxalocrotonate tautomerase [Pseudomonas sp. R5(2019)]NBA96562.1 4-oxalocrotonate tautomerase [Pseudomonas sp. R5(2019)]